MGFQARLCFFFFLTFAIMCFARETPLGMLMFPAVILSYIYITMAAGRPAADLSLYMIAVACLISGTEKNLVVEDYDGPKANPKHDPPRSPPKQARATTSSSMFHDVFRT